MAQIIAKISRGSKMDQIYIPKHRPGMPSGSYVVIKEIDEMLDLGKLKEGGADKLFYYHTDRLEPIKIEIINKMMKFFNSRIRNENIIITGSFLQAGFHFNDVDILILRENRTKDNKSRDNRTGDNESDVHLDMLKKEMIEKMGLEIHMMVLSTSALLQGISSDPMYEMMLSRFVSMKRFVFHVKRKINFKILDLRLLKSKDLMENYDLLSGEDKYYLTRNMIAIGLFLNGKRLSMDTVDKEICKAFGLKDIHVIKQNILNKERFLSEFKRYYNGVFDKILRGIENESKQK